MASDVVYFDPGRANGWLDQNRWSAKIERFLSHEGFRTVDSTQLVLWAKERIQKGDSPTSRVVFSQDMVPSEVLQGSPNGLLRRYLDSGGRVVWLGDTPLWWQSISPPRKVMLPNGSISTTNQDREEVWMGGLHYGVLKVQPLIVDSSSAVVWSPSLGNRLSSRWLSQRPIALEVGDDWSPFGMQDMTVTPLARTWATIPPSGWNALIVARWKKSGRRFRGFGLTAGIAATTLGGQVDFSESFPRELSLRPLSLACAWHVSFSPRFPDQGFYRFWDCGSEPDDPPEALLHDVLEMARATT